VIRTCAGLLIRSVSQAILCFIARAGLQALLTSVALLGLPICSPRLHGLRTLPTLALRGYRPWPRSVPSSSFIALVAVDWPLTKPILQVDQRRYSTRHITAARLLTPANPETFRSGVVLEVSVAHLVSATPPAQPNPFVQRFCNGREDIS
jgi:hypothetical protein